VAPPDEYNWTIRAATAAMRAVASITVATCSSFLLYLARLFRCQTVLFVLQREQRHCLAARFDTRMQFYRGSCRKNHHTVTTASKIVAIVRPLRQLISLEFAWSDCIYFEPFFIHEHTSDHGITEGPPCWNELLSHKGDDFSLVGSRTMGKIFRFGREQKISVKSANNWECDSVN